CVAMLSGFSNDYILAVPVASSTFCDRTSLLLPCAGAAILCLHMLVSVVEIQYQCACQSTRVSTVCMHNFINELRNITHETKISIDHHLYLQHKKIAPCVCTIEVSKNEKTFETHLLVINANIHPIIDHVRELKNYLWRIAEDIVTIIEVADHVLLVIGLANVA
ncbi:hypothetical protein ACJX0J_005652, partial [Zea mays]